MRGGEGQPGTSRFNSHLLFHWHNTAFYGLFLNLMIDFRGSLLSVSRRFFEFWKLYCFNFLKSEQAIFNISGAFLTCYHSIVLCALEPTFPDFLSQSIPKAVLWASQTHSGYFLCGLLGEPIWFHQTLFLRASHPKKACPRLGSPEVDVESEIGVKDVYEGSTPVEGSRFGRGRSWIEMLARHPMGALKVSIFHQRCPSGSWHGQAFISLLQSVLGCGPPLEGHGLG